MLVNMFRVDGVIYKISSTLWCLFILNGLIILTSLPILTIGASLTAAFSVTTKMIREDDNHIIKNYMRSFRENLSKSTIIWVVLLVVSSILVVDWSYLLVNQQLISVLTLGIVIFSIIISQFFQHAFFYLSRYEGTLLSLVKNGMKIMIHQPIKNSCLFILSVGPYILMFFSPNFFIFTIYISLFIGISFHLFLKTYLLLMIYNRYDVH